MSDPFLDTNVLLSHFLQEDPIQGAKATALVQRIHDGDLSVQTTDIVIFETVFTLQRVFRLARTEIAAALLSLLELPGIILPGKGLYNRVFELYLSTGAGFAGCYHAVLMQRLGIDEVLSFDRDFDRLPGIVRREE
jgi:predicted nucleic acid-binding protein